MVKKLYSAMEIDLKTRYALWYRRRLHRGQSSGKVVKLSSSEDRLRSVLFFLPDKIEHIRIVEYFIKSISHSELNGTEIRFLCSQKAGTRYLKLINTGIQMYNEEGLDQWGLPQFPLENRICKLNAEGIADLDPEFNPVHACLARASNASIRIGFDSRLADHYYNVTLELKEAAFLEKSYLKMEQLLGLA